MGTEVKTKPCRFCGGSFEKHQLLETVFGEEVCHNCAVLICHDCGEEVQNYRNPKCPNCGPRFIRPYVTGMKKPNGQNGELDENQLVVYERQKNELIRLAKEKIGSIVFGNQDFKKPNEVTPTRA